MLSKMSYQEFALWIEFFNRRPIGWREDDRAVKQMFATGNLKNVKPSSIFPSIGIMEQYQKEKQTGYPVIDRGSPLFAAMMNAKGGEKLKILGDI